MFMLASVKLLTGSSCIHSNSKCVVENVLSGNIEFTQEELVTIADILSWYEVQGERYVSGPPKQHLHLWG